MMTASGLRGWETKQPFLAVLRPEFEHSPDDVVLQRGNCGECGIGQVTFSNTGPNFMIGLGKSERGNDGYLLIRGDTLIGSGAEMLLPVGEDDVGPGPGPAEMANPHTVSLHAPWARRADRNTYPYLGYEPVIWNLPEHEIIRVADQHGNFIRLGTVHVPSGRIEISDASSPAARQRAFSLFVKDAAGNLRKTITITYTQPSIAAVGGEPDLLDVTARLEIQDGAPGEPDGTGQVTSYVQTRRIKNFMKRGDDPFNFEIQNPNPSTEEETAQEENIRKPRRVPVGNLPQPDPADDHQWYEPFSDRGTWTITSGAWVKRVTPIDPPQGLDRAVEISVLDGQDNVLFREERFFQRFGGVERVVQVAAESGGQQALVQTWQYDDRGELEVATEPTGRWTKYLRDGGTQTTIHQFKDNALVTDPAVLVAQNRVDIYTRAVVDLSGFPTAPVPTTHCPDENFSSVPVVTRSTTLQGVEIARSYEVNWPPHCGVTVNNIGEHIAETSMIRLTALEEIANLGTFITTHLSNPGQSPHSISHEMRFYAPLERIMSPFYYPMEMHNRPVGRLEPDGTVTLYNYSQWGEGQNPLNVEVITRRGRRADPSMTPVNQLLAIQDGVRTVERWDAFGNKAMHKSWDMQQSTGENDTANDILLEHREITQTEPLTNRPTRIDYMDGTYEQIWYTCCDVASRRDRDGLLTEYVHDAYRRLVYTVSASGSPAAQRTSYDYDATGRVTATKRGNPGQEVTLSQETYDLAGRLVASQDVLGSVTTYAETYDLLNARVIRTTTLPDPDGTGPLAAPTQVTTSYPDGSMYETGGTGQYPVRYNYGVEADTTISASTFVTWESEIRLGSQGETTEWVKQYRDPAGRSYKTVYADNATERTYFDAAGRVVKRVDPDGVTMLFREGHGFETGLPGVAADWNGQWRISATDLNQNGVIDFAGADLVSRSVTRVLHTSDNGAGDVRRTVSAVLSTINDADSWIVVGQQDVQTNGLATWSIAFGQQAESLTIINAPAQTRTVRNTNPDGSYSESITEHGRGVASRTYFAGGALHTESLSSYDAHGRLASITDTRGTQDTSDDRVVTYTYDDKDRAVSVSATGAQAGDPPLVSTMVYDALDRAVTVTAPDGTTTHSVYLPTGAVEKTWGDKAYPVEYTYDSQGRMKTLKTWQTFNFTSGQGTAGGATTTWTYSPARGWLTSKAYQGQGGPAYEYWPSGRMKKRTWVRGVHTNYTYTSGGVLQAIDYSDSTPDVAYSYNRLGRLVGVTDGVGTRTLSYDDAGRMLEEDFTSGVLDPVQILNQYDQRLRRDHHQLKVGGTEVSHVQFGYETNSSRLASVTKNGTHRAEYAYLAGDGLLHTTTYKVSNAAVGVVTRAYDRLNRLTQIQSDSTAGPDEEFTYTYNTANQRTRVDLLDGTYWLYEYDTLGQVTGGKRYIDLPPAGPDGDVLVPGQQFEYAFDHIGNRTQTKAGGDSAGQNLRTATYTRNLLNQYTTRTVPGTVDLMGFAPAANPVTFATPPGGTPVAADFRWGEFYQKALSWTNTSVARFEGVEIDTDDAQAGPEETRWVFLPKTPEWFSHDADGNLLSDGKWIYTWDGENRLIAMETNATLPAAMPPLRLEFVYDYMSRRCVKRVFDKSPFEAFAPAGGDAIMEGSAAAVVQGDDEPAEPENVGGGVVIPIGWSLKSTVKFVWDGWNLSAELDGQNAVRRTCAWGLDLSGSEQGAGGVGGLVFQYLAKTNATHHLFYDGNGNVTSLRDDTGSVSAAYEYGPFGETLTARGDADALAANAFGFSTKYADETGLYYYGYRYYNPGTGRWLNRDPIGEGDGPSLITLVRNSPIGSIDALGLWRRDSDWTSNSAYAIAECNDTLAELAWLITNNTGAARLLRTTSDTGGLFEGERVDVRPLLNELERSLRRKVVAAARAMPANRFIGDTRLQQFLLLPYTSANINAVFAGKYELECQMAARLVLLKGLVDQTTPTRYDRVFRGSLAAGLIRARTELDAAAAKPGDWIYFENDVRYAALSRVVDGSRGYWNGENVIAMGGNQYWGFATTPVARTEAAWLDVLSRETNKLIDKYNRNHGGNEDPASVLGFQRDQVKFFDIPKLGTHLFDADDYGGIP
ncbi:MAG: RHS repeat-associated core domain-containing protein [Phycisphaeraceae bacterium]|nr:RHS repeat-associated core domain-containing protein [Phycisphaeraceae bacterium]